ncbi:transmembrane protein 198 isoform X1 [Dermacentor silvarum]|uniref:transmembrane protein 198 isoform X1 n=1 Tax=Dermacentor silvarum TaxID=543639 RepID=UPI001899960B|nr:transmembrane protein 198 isoform X1 [Dermacentor silvarum]XP_037562533.1 transmembrane protein 198 isoform X1 [Dermacentor silvarum]XP_049517709.1 transmembrane protein 198 isoform X1 [Dermacentor silvarum]XP_049517710.1 transmembrane protein 198 isoform X1 [Dermacentor silvarum]
MQDQFFDHGRDTNSSETLDCEEFTFDYDIPVAILCGMYMVFGVVYTLYGYRCFKAVMFLTGFLFGSFVVFKICTVESLLPTAGNAGVSLGAGLLFGLITMLVQHAGLFLTGFHTGLFAGFASIALMRIWYTPSTVWLTVGILLACSILGAVLNLFWQKALTILGTSVYGGAMMVVGSDYFVSRSRLTDWSLGVILLKPPLPLCWFSWLILALWPLLIVIGVITQWRLTGRGTYHSDVGPTRRSRQLNLQRIRQEESRAEQRQRKYRYLYQVRTAHGDVISQSYIQSLQKKVCPPPDDSLSMLHSDLTHLTMLNPSESTATTLSQVT